MTVSLPYLVNQLAYILPPGFGTLHQDAEAVEAVNYVARRNGKSEPLTLGMLQDIDRDLGVVINEDEGRFGLSRMEIVKESLKDFKSANYKSLFATRNLERHTSLIWLIWLTIGKSPQVSSFSCCKGLDYHVYISHDKECIRPLAGETLAL